MFVIFFVILVIVFGLLQSLFIRFLLEEHFIVHLAWVDHPEKDRYDLTLTVLNQNENEAQEKDKRDLDNDFNLKW